MSFKIISIDTYLIKLEHFILSFNNIAACKFSVIDFKVIITSSTKMQ